MRALVQRVAGASVSVEGDVARIGGGLVVFVGVARDDDEADARYVVEKVANLRIFEDEDGRFNVSALEVSAELLVVSQFTLYADVRRGRRPSFTEAAAPEDAQPLFERAADGRAVPRDGPARGDGSLPGAHDGGAAQRWPGHAHDRQRGASPAAARVGGARSTSHSHL